MPLTPDRGDDRAVKVPVTLKMRLGWDERSLNAPELARRAEAAGVQTDFRAWPHPLPVLQGRSRLARGARRQGRDPIFRSSSTATSPRSRRRWPRSKCRAPTRSWSAAARRASRGCPVRSAAASKPALPKPRRRWRRSSRHVRTLYDEICRHYGLRIGLAPCAQASRLGARSCGPMQPGAGGDAQDLARRRF